MARRAVQQPPEYEPVKLVEHCGPRVRQESQQHLGATEPPARRDSLRPINTGSQHGGLLGRRPKVESRCQDAESKANSANRNHSSLASSRWLQKRETRR